MATENSEFIKFNHEEHEERLKNKFIVRRNIATKRHKRKIATEATEITENGEKIQLKSKK